MENPLQQVLLDLAQARDKFNSELLRAPAPGPLKQAMQEVDKLLSQADTDIRNVFRNMPKPPPPDEVLAGFQRGTGYLGQRTRYTGA